MEKSNISWTHNTWNPWVGCDKVAPECAHCYIGREIRKQGDWEAGDGSKREAWGAVYLTKTWGDPYKWNDPLRCIGVSTEESHYQQQCKRVFTCSLSDFFHAQVDKRNLWATPNIGMLPQHQKPYQKSGSALWRDNAWQVIRDTPNLVYLILTKRPELILSRLPKDWGEGYPNVWIGTSVGCRMTLSKIDSLRKVPVHPKAVRFLSCEPLLENVAWDINLDGIGWVIAGGESGSNPEYRWDAQADWRKEMQEDRGRRIMEITWAADLRYKAECAGIPFWFKQVTNAKSGAGEDALGEVVHQVPDPPYGKWWVEKGNPLIVLPTDVRGSLRPSGKSSNAGRDTR